MLMIPFPDYWQAVAHGIDAEERKASLLIKHSGSVGVAREAILRDVLVKQTPEPFRVATGFVYQPTPEPWTSKQCDLLVYDPTVAQPYYTIAGMVVLPRHATRLAIEVKTNLSSSEFEDALSLVRSVGWLPIPTMCFAYEGVTVERFLEYVVRGVIDAVCGVPDCVAVHRKNYVFVRSGYHMAPRVDAPDRHRPAKHQLLVDFGANEAAGGQAAASFLGFYDSFVRHQNVAFLVDWFNGLGLPDGALTRISDNGQILRGPIPAGEA
jgi:hypothetical protein